MTQRKALIVTLMSGRRIRLLITPWGGKIKVLELARWNHASRKFIPSVGRDYYGRIVDLVDLYHNAALVQEEA